jgi:muramidase (phage lysozyme)
VPTFFGPDGTQYDLTDEQLAQYGPIPPWVPRNSKGQPYAPLPADQKANDAASYSAIAAAMRSGRSANDFYGRKAAPTDYTSLSPEAQVRADIAAEPSPPPPRTGTGVLQPVLQAREVGLPPGMNSPGMTARTDLPVEARAFLDAISGPESRGQYNVRYTPKGGATFDSFDSHPRIYEPGPKGPSSAAGRYQMVYSTWEPLAQKLGLTDFSPPSQDTAAWTLAGDTYHQKTGRDLLADLKAGDTSKVAGALGSRWPTITKSIGTFANNLAKYNDTGSKPMYPSFGNDRALAALSPSGGTDSTQPDPGSVAAATLANVAAGTGGSATGGATANDPTANLMQLLTKGGGSFGFNPSATLARMAAGFLGGKGPADALSKGFGGIAQAQEEGNSPLMNLVKMSMAMQGLGLKTQEAGMHKFTALVNAGVPPATAAAASGVNLPGAAGAGTATSDVHGDDYLKSLDPNMANQVKALADGRMPFPSGFALKTPYWQQMISHVSQYDPEFDAVNYKAREATRKDFTSGKSAQNVTSANTLIGHMGTLQQAAEGLNNSSIPAYNSVTNFLSSNTGDPRVKAFNVAKQAVADELTRLFRGSGGSVHDVEGWERSIDAAGSPEQLQATVKQAVNLAASRINAIGEQYKRGLGTTAQPLSLLTDSAQKTLRALPGGDDLIRELGGKPEAIAGAPTPAPAKVGNGAPKGALSPADQALIDRYLKATQ